MVVSNRELLETHPGVTTIDVQVSVVVVSFNTRELLRECIRAIKSQNTEVRCEIIIVDNASCDGSADMVAADYPEVRLVRADTNLGFAAANNLAFALSRSPYVVLVNSDAFLHPGALSRAVAHMDANPQAGLGGGRLFGADNSARPSARFFPSLLNEFLMISGLAAKYPKSRLMGRSERTWDDPLRPAPVDWVPGTCAIIRRQALEKIGYFDERFFFYFEEVDLCRRIKRAGYEVWYWPDILVTHLGGASAKTIDSLHFSPPGSQLTLWRMRSQLLYYRKYHGALGVWMVMALESGWHRLRLLKNLLSRHPSRFDKATDSRMMIAMLGQVYRETRGGRVSPPQPW